MSLPVEIPVLVVICLNCIISIILGLFVSNWTYIFYKLSKHNIHVISARKPKSIILFGICLSVALLIRMPTLASFPNNGIGYFKGSKALAVFLFHCTTSAMSYILLFRTYLVFFDIKYCQHLEDQNWRNHIETTKTESKSDFYITRRATLGNPSIVGGTLLCVWLLFTSWGTISVIILGEDTKHRVFAMLSTILLPVLCLASVTFLLPKFDDIFKIRAETKRMSSVCLAGICIWFAINAILKPVPGSMEYVLLSTFHILILVAPAHYSLAWVLKQFHLPLFYWHVIPYMQLENTEALIKHTSSKEITVNVQDEDQKQGTSIRFQTMFEEEGWFKLFARHALHEFALEGFLFFVECHQFNECISSNTQNNKDACAISTMPTIIDDVPSFVQTKSIEDIKSAKDKWIGTINKIELTSNAPRSTIVENMRRGIVKGMCDGDTVLNAMYVAAADIFLKYIVEDAHFAINIPYSVRNTLYISFGCNTEKEHIVAYLASNGTRAENIQVLFDDARREAFRLMSFSFLRFKQTQEYKMHLDM
eukprot:224144_1